MDPIQIWSLRSLEGFVARAGLFTNRLPNVREFQLYHFDATLMILCKTHGN
jgi:hypothetical protein